MQKYSDVFGKKPYINEENTNEINNKNINIQTPLRSQKDKKGVNKNGYQQDDAYLSNDIDSTKVEKFTPNIRRQQIKQQNQMRNNHKSK